MEGPLGRPARRVDLLVLVLGEEGYRGPRDVALAREQVEVVSGVHREREDARLDPIDVHSEAGRVLLGLRGLPGRRGGRGGRRLGLGRRPLRERRLLALPELRHHDAGRVGRDVVVLERVHSDLVVAVGEEVEVAAVGVEARVEVLVEVVGELDLPGLDGVVEEDRVVAVLARGGPRDPAAVGRPGVVADLPGELVVVERRATRRSSSASSWRRPPRRARSPCRRTGSSSRRATSAGGRPCGRDRW